MSAKPKHIKLIAILEETREYLSLPNNDFAWSSWKDMTAALNEIDSLIESIKAGDLPERSDIEVLFLPTGPIQEVSVSSGWGEDFLRIADQFDLAITSTYDSNALAFLQKLIFRLFN